MDQIPQRDGDVRLSLMSDCHLPNCTATQRSSHFSRRMVDAVNSPLAVYLMRACFSLGTMGVGLLMLVIVSMVDFIATVMVNFNAQSTGLGASYSGDGMFWYYNSLLFGSQEPHFYYVRGFLISKGSQICWFCAWLHSHMFAMPRERARPCRGSGSSRGASSRR
jgi:hypothetical protein